MSQNSAVERKIIKLMGNNTVMHLETIFFPHKHRAYSLEITAGKIKYECIHQFQPQSEGVMQYGLGKGEPDSKHIN